ncbi:hypothetical protein TUM4641_02710 [Shewanella morhuae]|nr:hypothetical protein TUM4641_02710 [Shewanella morhuae]
MVVEADKHSNKLDCSSFIGVSLPNKIKRAFNYQYMNTASNSSKPRMKHLSLIINSIGYEIVIMS